jgi:hypothetical protein
MPDPGFVFDDGGRAQAGYKGTTGDCVTRAVAIATRRPYQEVYDALNEAIRARPARGQRKRKSSARTGVPRRIYERYLADLGWRWVPTMRIGSGTTVHLRADELPSSRIIARLSGHLSAVVDGVVRDDHDPCRDGTRCVYGYFTRADG